MTLGEIINQYRLEHKISMDVFSKQSGLTKGYISMLEKNEHPKSKKPIVPTEETLLKVARGMNVPVDYILNKLDPNQEIQINVSPERLGNLPQQAMTDAVEVIPSTVQKITATANQLEHKRQLVVLDTAEKQLEEQNVAENSKNIVADNIIQFPKLFPYDFYDQPLSAGTGQYLNEVRVEQIELPIEVDADFVVPIYGDSMEPEYHSGDYVFVELTYDLSDGDIGVFEYYGDAYIKQLVINDSGAFLHSLNTKYKDIPVNSDSDFRIIGKVVERYREM